MISNQMILNSNVVEDDRDIMYDYPIKQYVFKAICTSESCISKVARTRYAVSYLGVVKPNLAKTAQWCPDCEHALFWEKTIA